jgi:hypothetical protein
MSATETETPADIALRRLLTLMVHETPVARASVGSLLHRAWGPDPSATSTLAHLGIRPVRRCLYAGEQNEVNSGCTCANCFNERLRTYIPRLTAGAAIWLHTTRIAPLLRATDQEDFCWEAEISRAGTRSRWSVIIGGISGRAVWLTRETIDRCS